VGWRSGTDIVRLIALVPTTDCEYNNASDQEIVLIRGTPPFAGEERCRRL